MPDGAAYESVGRRDRMHMAPLLLSAPASDSASNRTTAISTPPTTRRTGGRQS